MLFCSTHVLVRNNEIVNNSFLQIKYKVIKDMLEIFETKWSEIRKVMSARLLEIIAKLAILNFIINETKISFGHSLSSHLISMPFYLVKSKCTEIACQPTTLVFY